MTYAKLKEIFCELKREHPTQDLTAHIIFTEDSFKKQYSLLSRTYRISSDEKAFWSRTGSRSIFAYCLDKNSDQGVRLDWYMEDEGNPGGWKVERCYILEHLRDANSIPNAQRAVQDDGNVAYCFGETCIQVREVHENGKVCLEPISGNRNVCLPIDWVHGYCFLLEKYLNGGENI